MIKTFFSFAIVFVTLAHVPVQAITQKDEDSIARLSQNLSSLFSKFVRSSEFQNMNFEHIFENISPSTPPSVKQRIQSQQAAVKKILGDPKKPHKISELITRIENNKKNASKQEFLGAAKALRHVSSQGKFKGSHPFGDLLTEKILIEKVIAPCASTWKTNAASQDMLAEAFYELSQVYSHVIDFKKYEEKKGGHYLMVLDAQKNKVLKGEYPFVMKDLQQSRQKLLRYAVTLAPDKAETLSAWSRIIELEEYDQKHCPKIYDLGKSANWDNFIKSIQRQYQSKKQKIKTILEAKAQGTTAALSAREREEESRLVHVPYKWQKIQ